MKNILIMILIFFMLCGNCLAIVTGYSRVPAVAACTGTGTVGYTDAATAFNSNPAVYKVITAGADICVGVGRIEVDANFTAGKSLRIVVWDNGTGATLGTSNELTGDSTAEVKTVSFPTPFQISNTTVYRVGIVCSEAIQWGYVAGAAHYFFDNGYSSYPTTTGISWSESSSSRNPIISVSDS